MPIKKATFDALELKKGETLNDKMWILAEIKNSVLLSLKLNVISEINQRSSCLLSNL